MRADSYYGVRASQMNGSPQWEPQSFAQKEFFFTIMESVLQRPICQHIIRIKSFINLCKVMLTLWNIAGRMHLVFHFAARACAVRRKSDSNFQVQLSHSSYLAPFLGWDARQRQTVLDCLGSLLPVGKWWVLIGKRLHFAIERSVFYFFPYRFTHPFTHSHPKVGTVWFQPTRCLKCERFTHN